MNSISRTGERRDGPEGDDPRHDVRALAPASGAGSDSALQMWKRRERARALLNVRDGRKPRGEHHVRSGADRPS